MLRHFANLSYAWYGNWNQIGAEFMLNSFWFHSHPELHNALYSNWGQIRVEFMPNSCWIHADFIFTLNFHNALWVILNHNNILKKTSDATKCKNPWWIWH